ncbi:transposase domain-containing protein [Anopheles sinensis]|uniref:Transposase domain-containing protein n=1 Tax=Anopheles sinensis TaxID=74873 RepID=A0A084VAS4_ANOSI|nr:transposase domain-containing protein [Anopheles sinensis]
MVFAGLEAEKRTDELFCHNGYPQHRKHDTPLMEIRNFDLIQDVPVGDRLHLIDLGVTKRMLEGWKKGTISSWSRKWSEGTCGKITATLGLIHLPAEIHRKLRSIDYLSLWKGSEYGSFLHYASLVVLQDNFGEQEYRHFKKYFCGISLLSPSAFKDYWPIAGELLDSFIEELPSVHGEQLMTSNIHNLQHLLEECNRFGPLGTFSSYPFEINCIISSA